MARPERKDIDYFPFYVQEGKKMFYIQMQHGNDGFTTVVKLLMELGKAENHYLELASEEDKLYLADVCSISTDKLIEILNDLAKVNKIDSKLWSEKQVIVDLIFLESIQDAYLRRNNDCPTIEYIYEKCGVNVVQKPVNVLHKSIEVPQLPQSKVEYSIENQRKENQIIKKESKEDNNNLSHSGDSSFNEFKISPSSTTFSFEELEKAYPKNAKRTVCKALWDKVPEKDKIMAKDSIVNFTYSVPDTKFLPSLENYILEEHWYDKVDEISFNDFGHPIKKKKIYNGVNNKKTAEQLEAERLEEAELRKGYERLKKENDVKKEPLVMFNDLRSYFFEKLQSEEKSKIEAEKFFDHYNSNGWKVGNNKMNDWQASVRNWINKMNDFKKQGNGDEDFPTGNSKEDVAKRMEYWGKSFEHLA